jgi:hypothetical protein
LSFEANPYKGIKEKYFNLKKTCSAPVINIFLSEKPQPNITTTTKNVGKIELTYTNFVYPLRYAYAYAVN